MTSTEQPASPRIGPPQSSIRKLAATITGNDVDPTNLRRRWAVVTAVNADLSVDVSLDGITLPSIKRVATYIPVVGDTVRLDVNGTDIVVAGATVTAANDLSNLPPAIAANVASIGAMNGVVTGHTALLATHTSQISNNTTAVTGLQDKVTGTTVKFSSQSVAASGVTVGGAGLSVNVGGAGGGLTKIGSDAAGNPGLLFPGNNAALLAGSNGLYVVNATNTGGMPITASAAQINGDHHVTGAIFVTGGLNASFGANLANATTWSWGLSTNGIAPVNQQIQTQDITATRNIAVSGTLFYPGGQLPASERFLKDNIEDLGDPFPFLRALKPSRFTWIDQEHHDDRAHVGVMVDEMAEADPDTVLPMPRMPDDTFGSDEEHYHHIERYNRNIGRRPDERALLAYLIRAAQVFEETIERQSQEIAELRTQVNSQPSS